MVECGSKMDLQYWKKQNKQNLSDKEWLLGLDINTVGGIAESQKGKT